MRRHFWPILVLLLLYTIGAEARIVESFKVRGWRGDAFVSDQTGKFDSCVAIARYRSQISMSVQVDSNYNWWIGFSASGWTMTPGEKIPLQYRVDRGAWQQGTAEAITSELARMPMPAGGYIITRFRRGRVLYVYDQSSSYQFKLTGTSRLLARLASCVDKNSRRYGADAPSASTPAPNPNKSAKSGGWPVDGASSGNSKLIIESTQALFNLMGHLGVRDINLKNEANRETALKGIHAVAANDNRTVVAHMFAKGDYDSEKAVLANIVAEAAKTCEGDFSSGTGSQQDKDDPLFYGHSVCEAGDVEIAEKYVIVQRQGGGIYFYALSDTSVGEGGGSPSAPLVTIDTNQFHRAARASAP